VLENLIGQFLTSMTEKSGKGSSQDGSKDQAGPSPPANTPVKNK